MTRSSGAEHPARHWPANGNEMVPPETSRLVSRWCAPECLSVEHRKQGVEAFRQQRVSEDRIRHGGVSELAQHGDLDHGHDLAAFTAEDRAAQDLPAVRVDDGLHEAACLPGLDGP